jgi:hypothetical protein
MEGVERCRSGRWLHADWGYRMGVVREREREREKEKRDIKARLPWVPPLPCVHRLEDKRNKRQR